jgi:predicted TIM-barrel fold metal-dependent hydrolase
MGSSTLTRTRVVDVHQHVGPWPFPGKWGGIELNLELMERRGIDVAIISSTEAIVDDVIAGNARLAKEITGHPNLLGYVTLNPRYPDLSAHEMEKYADHPQFVGFKIHTTYSGTAMGEPRLAALFERMAESPRPLLIHTWGAAAVRALAALAARHPQLPVIVAHAGGDAWRTAIAAAQGQANLWLDFAMSAPERTRIERAVAALGAGRVLFGSDATLFDPQYMLSCFEEAQIPDLLRPQVMGGNAERLFGLGDVQHAG